MSNPKFPIPVPKERVGGIPSDPADTGPQVPGDQKMGTDGVLYQTHNGGNRKPPENTGVRGGEIRDLFVWEE